ncbi:MAG: DUF1365 domain-containing protein [Beijerinckiaceae bacterium]|nr:DUF1365 domain-containing protein [Beijerinckiaceae bacterium]
MSDLPAATMFPPPEGVAWIYSGRVMHARLKPKAHRFNYGVYNLLIDLDRLDEANRLSWAFSVNSLNILSFFEHDHAAPGEPGARAQADRLLRDAGLSTRAARILLLCYPRVLGFVFNPISVYFAYDAEDRLTALIYEVRNTFGQRHSYVALVEDGQLTEAGLRQERDKRFYVSPFMEMQQRYCFRVLPPGERLAIRILEHDAQGPILAATFHGWQKPLGTPSVLASFVSVPLLTLKVVAGIVYEAAKLWLKGLRPTPRPAPPEFASYNDLKR